MDKIGIVRPDLLAAGVLILLLVALIGFVRRTYTRGRIKREAALRAEQYTKPGGNYAFSIPVRTAARHFRLVKKLSLHYGMNLPVLMHLDDYWISRMEQHASGKLMNRLLTYAPEKGFFPCFKAALESGGLLKTFLEWIERSGELMAMDSIALSCGGREFDGKKAIEAFADYKDQLFEMTGSPVWHTRYFALRILLYDSSDRAARAVWEAFGDPSFQIRRITAKLSIHEDRNELYRHLLQLLLEDPVFEVRRAARERIEGDFPDFYAIPPDLSHTRALHLTELLNPDIPQDREYAFSLLDGKNEELALEASRVLTRSGSLRRLFRQVFHEDAPSLKRTLHLLTNAARVHSTDFLEVLEESDNPGTLLVAAKLLREYGDLKYTTALVQRVRDFDEAQKNREPLRGIYLQALKTACKRGDDHALALVREELSSRQSDRALHEAILPVLPKEHAHVYIHTLFAFLKNEEYPTKTVLRGTLAGLNPELTLTALFDLIKNPGQKISRKVQEQALRVLCEIGIPYTIQHVLEHLPLLSVEMASSYSNLLATHFAENYRERVSLLLESSDSRLRSRLISSIPAPFFDSFREQLLSALKDSDPDVRSACAWAFLKNGKASDREKVSLLLLDPVESVRKNAAGAFATHGDEKYFANLKRILHDGSEMIPVKISVIEGLSRSHREASVDVLVEQVVEGGELRPHALKTLSEQRDGSMISRLLSHIEKLDPGNRELLIGAVRSMGESAEAVLETVLFDNSSSLRPVAVEVLESIGTVDARIRRLSNRDPSIRREAASFLFQVGTTTAYRGLIQAARDPDDEVRGYVVKALDAMNSDRGKSILEELKNDPQRKVRSYTNWALERYQAKRL